MAQSLLLYTLREYAYEKTRLVQVIIRPKPSEPYPDPVSVRPSSICTQWNDLKAIRCGHDGYAT